MVPKTPIEFELRFSEGRGILDLRERAPIGTEIPIGVSELHLEVPDLRSGERAQPTHGFRTRRLKLQSLELTADTRAIADWLGKQSQLERCGISGLTLRAKAEHFALSAEAQVGGARALVTTRLHLVTAPGGDSAGERQAVHVVIGDVRTYGLLPAPAPLVPSGILIALRISGLERIGARHFTIQALERALWQTLPPSGFRLPERKQSALERIEISADRLLLRYGGSARTDEAPAPLGRVRRIAESDRLLAAGDFQRAIETLDAMASAGTDPLADLELSEHRLEILCGMPSRLGEAEALAEALMVRHPERIAAQLTLANLWAHRGESRRAAERYVRVAELAREADEADDYACAALRAGTLLAECRGEGATLWLERALVAGREEAADLLAACYAVEQKWNDLLGLEQRRLEQLPADDRTGRAGLHARMGRIWLDHLNDPVRARDELGAAVDLDPTRASVHTSLAEALVQISDPGSPGSQASFELALASLARATELVVDEDGQSAIRLRAAEVARMAGKPEIAVEHLRLVSGEFALQAAAELAQLGAQSEALAAYDHALAVAPARSPERAEIYTAMGRLELDAAKNFASAESGEDASPQARLALDRAEAHIAQALAISERNEALWIALEIAERTSQFEKMATLATRLGERGDLQARMKQVSALLQLGRTKEAADAAELAAQSEDPRALESLVHVRQLLGQPVPMRAALERLVKASSAIAPRLALAHISASEGELATAKALLIDASERADPSERLTVLEALCDVLLRQGEDEALADALGELAKERLDPQARARALSAQGAARARIGQIEEAAASYQQAVMLDPDDIQARTGLGESSYTLQHWQDAREALEPLFDRKLPPRGERALRLGELTDRLGDRQAAIRFYQAALEEASGADATRAWNGLIGQYYSLGNHEAHAVALITAADDPRLSESIAVRAGRLVSAADILRKRLSRVDDAVALYERALLIDPLQIAALDALESIAESTGDLERCAQVLGRKIAATARRPAQQKAILGRLATLQIQLGRSDAARQAYRRTLEIDPDFRPAHVYFAAQAKTKGDVEAEIGHLVNLVAFDPDGPVPESVPEELGRLAELYLSRDLDDKAADSARRALALDASIKSAQEVLQALSSKTSVLSISASESPSEPETPSELGPTAPMTVVDSRPEALLKAGHIEEYLALLENEPPERMPLEARQMYADAAELASKRDEHPRAAAFLDRALEHAPDDPELWVRLGRLQLGVLGDLERAAHSFSRAYALDRSRSDVLLPLADFHHRAGAFHSAAAAYRQALARNAVPKEELGRVHLQLADYARDAKDSLAEEEALSRAAQAGQKEAWTRLASLYRDSSENRKLGDTLLSHAKVAEGEERSRVLREAVGLVPPEEASALDEQLLQYDPTDNDARDRILERLRDKGDLSAFADRLEKEIERMPADRRGPYSAELGHIVGSLGEDARALAAFRTSLEVQPTMDAARGLMRILEREGREAEAAPLLEAAMFDPKLPTSELFGLSQLTARAHFAAGGDSAKAVDWMNRARTAGVAPDVSPTEQQALLRSAKRWAELHQALESAARTTDDLERRIDLEKEAAEVLGRELGHLAEAARRLGVLFDTYPHRRDLATRAREFYGRAGRPIYALALLETELKLAPPEELPLLRLRRGEILLQAGADHDAESDLFYVLENTALTGAAHAALAQIAERRGDEEAVVDHLVSAARSGDLDREQVALHAADATGRLRARLDSLPASATAEIAPLRHLLADLAPRLGDSAQERRSYESLLAVNPDRTDVLEALARIYVETRVWPEAVQALARLSSLTEKPVHRADLLFQMGEVLRLELDRPTEAIEAYLKAVDAHPGQVGALRRLIPYYFDEGDFSALAEVVRDLELLSAPLDEVRLEAALGLAFLGKRDAADRLFSGDVTAVDCARLLARTKVKKPADFAGAFSLIGIGAGNERGIAEALIDSAKIPSAPLFVGAHAALGALADQLGDLPRAVYHDSIVAFVQGRGAFDQRIGELIAQDPEAAKTDLRAQLREACPPSYATEELRRRALFEVEALLALTQAPR